MNRIFPVILLMFLASLTVLSQAGDDKKAGLEAEIRKLDQAEAKAFLEKDEKAIERFFSKDVVINNPLNSLTFGTAGLIAVIRSGRSDYRSFERNAESVKLLGNTAIVMGNETVVLKGAAGGPDNTIRRRYTHVWMKTEKDWQIVARHANAICP